MNQQQINAIRCAYLDLVGAAIAHDNYDIEAHDWRAHRLTIEEMEEAFPELNLAELSVEPEEDE